MTPAEALASAIMEASDHCDIPNSQGLVTPVETAHILAALDAAGWVVVPADQASVEWRKGYGFGYEAARAVSEIGRSP